MRRSNKYIILIAENLLNLYVQGIPLIKSLDLLSELNLNKHYKKSIESIRENLICGESLSDAFSKYPKLYPKFFMGILKIGENSGNIPKALKNIVKYYSEINNFNREIKKIMIYPLFLVISILVSSGLIFFLFIPKIYKMISSINSNVPENIKISYQIVSEFYKNPLLNLSYIISWFIFPIFIVIYILVKNNIIQNISCKTKIVKSQYEYLLVLILFIGVNSGKAIGNSLALCINSTEYKNLKYQLNKIYSDIIKGQQLHVAITRNCDFSKYSLSLIKIGEESGNLVEALEKLEDSLGKKRRDKIRYYLSFIEPVTIITIALLMSAFLMVFVIPIFDSFKISAS